MIEAWKKIVGYEGRYEVSNMGRVRRISDGGIMRLAINQNGYYHVILSKDGVAKDFRVHRLVATHFIENKENKRDVNHKNGKKTDNRASNLEWLTHAENERHKIYTLKKSGKLYAPCRPVECIDTGIKYRSICEAKRELGLAKSAHIQEVCAGKLKHDHGLRWRYIE